MVPSLKPLHVERLSINFGGLQALINVDFALQEGERRVIIGPNGAGKTTFFHLISGVLSPSSGSISIFGRDVTNVSPHRRALLGLARTFQVNNLFANLTVMDNVIMACQFKEGIRFSLVRPLNSYRRLFARAEKLMDEWGLSDKAGVLVSNLSYGDQRVLEVVLALAQEPKLLLLDEPTGGLSPAETLTVTNMLKNLPRSITALMIEHDMDVAFGMADTVTVFYMGEVLAEGTPDEVKRDSRVQEIYLGMPA